MDSVSSGNGKYDFFAVDLLEFEGDSGSESGSRSAAEHTGVYGTVFSKFSDNFIELIFSVALRDLY